MSDEAMYSYITRGPGAVIHAVLPGYTKSVCGLLAVEAGGGWGGSVPADGPPTCTKCLGHSRLRSERPTGSLAGEGARGLLSSIVMVVRDAIVHAQSNPEGATSPWPYGERILTKVLTDPSERTEAVGYDWKIERDPDDGLWYITHARWSLVGQGETLEAAAADLDKEAIATFAVYQSRDDLSDEAQRMVDWLSETFHLVAPVLPISEPDTEEENDA